MASMANNFAQGFSQVLMRNQSFAGLMNQAAQNLTANLITATLNMAAGLNAGKLDQAKDAARWGFNWGAKYGGPLAPVLAPAMATTFFAGVMAFENGGVVPGTGRGDVVPAMLTPGEGVVPGSVMAGLSDMARSGRMGGNGNTVHVHVRPTYNVNTIDGDGMQAALTKHTDVLTRHMERSLRRMNR
jgi:hypothetical protein